LVHYIQKNLTKSVESVRKTDTNTAVHVCESTKNMTTTLKLTIVVMTIIIIKD